MGTVQRVWGVLLVIVGGMAVSGTVWAGGVSCPSSTVLDLGTVNVGDTQVISNSHSTECPSFRDKWRFTLDTPARVGVGIQDVMMDLGGLGTFDIVNLKFFLKFVGDGRVDGTTANGGDSFLTPLASGDYKLIVKGDINGSLGGLYSGPMTIFAIPIPPAILLFATGLLGLAVISRHRSKG